MSKDIRTYSRQAEELYEQRHARGSAGFPATTADRPPQEAITFRMVMSPVYDHLLGVNLRIPTDLLVLVVGLTTPARFAGDQLKLARSEDGFYMELHPKLGPVETAIQGVYLAGTARAPKTFASRWLRPWPQLAKLVRSLRGA